MRQSILVILALVCIGGLCLLFFSGEIVPGTFEPRVPDGTEAMILASVGGPKCIIIRDPMQIKALIENNGTVSGHIFDNEPEYHIYFIGKGMLIDRMMAVRDGVSYGYSAELMSLLNGLDRNPDAVYLYRLYVPGTVNYDQMKRELEAIGYLVYYPDRTYNSMYDSSSGKYPICVVMPDPMSDEVRNNLQTTYKVKIYNSDYNPNS